MIERLKNIKEKYEEINEELLKPEVLNDFKKTTALAKEKKNLQPTVDKFILYEKTLNEIEGTTELLDDPDMSDIASLELKELENQKTKLQQELEILLIPKDPNDDKNIIMEIRGAAGGDEANIFAGDLFRMYTRYGEKNGWKIEVLNELSSTSGGFSQIELMIKGENVYSKLKFESGSHRVQRVPETETQGRVHTSTATVAVLPEVEDVDLVINENELKIDVYHSGGAGGQSVNTTDSAVRITHLPTGVVVTCQNERSQLKNKQKALEILKSKLIEEEQRKKELELGEERRSKIGSGDRSEKIRTYNYPQNRVTDHRIGMTLMDLSNIMDGNLDEIIEALITEDQRIKLADNND